VIVCTEFVEWCLEDGRRTGHARRHVKTRFNVVEETKGETKMPHKEKERTYTFPTKYGLTSGMD